MGGSWEVGRAEGAGGAEKGSGQGSRDDGRQTQALRCREVTLQHFVLWCLSWPGMDRLKEWKHRAGLGPCQRWAHSRRQKVQRGEERGEPPALGDGHQPGRWDKAGHGRAGAGAGHCRAAWMSLGWEQKCWSCFTWEMSWPDASEQVLKNQNN